MVTTIMMSALGQQQTFRPLVDIIDLGRRSSSRGITMKFPHEEITTLRVPFYLVANKRLSNDAAARWRRQS
jgi:hypothetical protein